MDGLQRQQDLYDCNKIFTDIKDLKADKAEADEKIRVLLENSKDNKKEIEHDLF